MSTKLTRVTVISFVSAILFLMFVGPAQSQTTTATAQDFLSAVVKGDRDRVAELLKKDPSFARASDHNGVSATLLAVYNDRKDVVDLLLRSGLELNIFEASATGQTSRVDAVVRANHQVVNAFARDGFTPLGLATFFGHKDTVEALLAAGANVNLKSNNALTASPLQSAAVMNQIEIAKLLLAKGADVNITGESGYTPLHEVAGSGRLEFAKLLLDHGANINAKGNDGKTPLTIAVENKQVEMATFLRSRGGN